MYMYPSILVYCGVSSTIHYTKCAQSDTVSYCSSRVPNAPKVSSVLGRSCNIVLCLACMMCTPNVLSTVVLSLGLVDVNYVVYLLPPSHLPLADDQFIRETGDPLPGLSQLPLPLPQCLLRHLQSLLQCSGLTLHLTLQQPVTDGGERQTASELIRGTGSRCLRHRQV